MHVVLWCNLLFAILDFCFVFNDYFGSSEVGDDQRLESGGRAGITGLPGDEGKAQARLAGEDGIDKESETSSKGDGHAEDGTQDADQEEVKEPKYMTVDLTQPYADRPSPPIALNQGLEAQKYLITNKIPEMFEVCLVKEYN